MIDVIDASICEQMLRNASRCEKCRQMREIQVDVRICEDTRSTNKFNKIRRKSKKIPGNKKMLEIGKDARDVFRC